MDSADLLSLHFADLQFVYFGDFTVNALGEFLLAFLRSAQTAQSWRVL